MSITSQYTEPVTKGREYTSMLPRGTALVLEGGGVRAYYTAGVLEAFLEKGIMFPYIIGVSAGVGNALSYISGQMGRNKTLLEKYTDRRYVGIGNLLKHGSIFGYDFIYGDVPGKHLFWDREVYEKSKTRFLMGATDCRTAEAVWYEKHDLDDKFTAARASCSVPYLAKIVKYRGRELLDGGIAAPIPIDQSVKDGNSFHVIVLTRNANYTKRPLRYERLLTMYYRKYPRLAEALITRHDDYNRQITLCEELEREGRALILRPQLPLKVGRITRDLKKILPLYDEGLEEGREAVNKIIYRP